MWIITNNGFHTVLLLSEGPNPRKRENPPIRKEQEKGSSKFKHARQQRLRGRHQRHSQVDVEARMQPDLRRNLPRCLHGVDNRIGLRCFPPEIPRDAIQRRQKSGERVHWFHRDSWCLYRYFHGRLSAQTHRAKAERCRAVCPNIECDLFGLLRTSVLPGL